MAERLTWNEIQREYPDQWVALEDIKYLDNEECNVESAVVVCTMSVENYISSRINMIHEGKHYTYKRTEDIKGLINTI